MFLESNHFEKKNEQQGVNIRVENTCISMIIVRCIQCFMKFTLHRFTSKKSLKIMEANLLTQFINKHNSMGISFRWLNMIAHSKLLWLWLWNAIKCRSISGCRANDETIKLSKSKREATWNTFTGDKSAVNVALLPFSNTKQKEKITRPTD